MARVSSGSTSKQNYGTPQRLIDVTDKRFGPIVFDLAAEPENRKHARYFGPEVIVVGKTKNEKGKEIEIFEPNPDKEAVALDSLKQDWHKISPSGLLWLNPPFKRIDPWAAKCYAEAMLGARIAFLVPAAVGADWFVRHVWKKADRYYLNGRLSFSGEPYMKDCMIAYYWPGMTGREFAWDWRKNYLIGDEPVPSNDLDSNDESEQISEVA